MLSSLTQRGTVRHTEAHRAAAFVRPRKEDKWKNLRQIWDPGHADEKAKIPTRPCGSIAQTPEPQ